MTGTNGHALVTGASGGIGSAVCALLAKDGWMVTGVDRRPGDDDSTSWRTIVADLGVEGAGARASRAAREAAPVTAVVHAAALQVLGPAGAVTAACWREVLRVNVLCLDEIVGELRGDLALHRGAVVAVSSVHAQATTADMAAYATSKAALNGWVRAAALDLAPYVRVNAVQPGAVLTPMLRAGLTRRPGDGDEAKALARLAARTPLGCVADPAALARVVQILLDPETGGFMTGSVLTADGGALLRLGTE